MATRTKKAAFDFQAVMIAAATGAVVQPMQDIMQEQVFTNKPEMVPVATAALGLGLSYFGGETLKPAGLALVAVGAADLAGDLFAGNRARQIAGGGAPIQGLSRIDFQLDGAGLPSEGGEPLDAPEMDELQAMLEESDGTTDW
jgi:hypothetical protein